MALHICKRKHKSLTNPFLIHLFSTSQNDNNDNHGHSNTNSSSSSLNSNLGDIRATLRNQTPRNQTTSFPSSGSRKLGSHEDTIRKNLAEFHLRSAAPPPKELNLTASQSQTQSQSQSESVSFQQPHNKNNFNEPFDSRSRENPSFMSILDTLRNLKRSIGDNINSNNNRGNVRDKKFKLKPDRGDNANTVIGGIRGTQELPDSMLRKEEKAVVEEKMKTEFLKPYSMDELGEKLRKLRPEETVSEFSLAELNERLMRLRENEMEVYSKFVGPSTAAIFQGISSIESANKEKARVQRHNILDNFGKVGDAQEILKHPPKNHLVEKYFHPDNMSSAEKMKIELAKVREEFKMSESDCGSARVQIAQLTYRIKHLSSVLQKKDKHSRKGLLAMVQRRKRLLKYLRRTDWDSYCMVLSKLGLRDNPDYKTAS